MVHVTDRMEVFDADLSGDEDNRAQRFGRVTQSPCVFCQDVPRRGLLSVQQTESGPSEQLACSRPNQIRAASRLSPFGLTEL